jgi:hypothetical protein
MPGDRIPHTTLATIPWHLLHDTMSLIKNCTVVICNGNVAGMHPTREAADQQAYELAQEWKLQSDCGAEASSPKIAVLSFNSWMQLQDVAVF